MDDTPQAATQPDHNHTATPSSKRRRTTIGTKEKRVRHPSRDELRAALQAAEQRAEKAERRARHLEARLAALVSTSGQWMWTRDSNGRVEVNLTGGRMSEGRPEGDSPKENSHEPDWIDAIHPDDRERTLSAWAEAMLTKRAYENVQRMRGADGFYRTILVRAVPNLENDDDSVPEWIGTFTDITDHMAQLEREHAARAEAEKAKAQLQAVVDVLPLGLVIVDARGQFLMNNRALYRIWGDDAPAVHDLASYREYKGYWPNTRRRLKSKDWALARSLLHGEVVIGEEVDIEAFDGERKTILSSTAPIRDACGTIIGAVAAMLDVTAREQLEQALRASQAEARYRADEVDAILEAITDGVLLYNAHGQLIRTNAAARRLLAGDNQLPEAWAQKTMVERVAAFVAHDLDGNVLSPEQYPLIRIMRGEVLTGANSAEIETHRLDRSPITISVSGAPLYDEHGVLRGAVCVSRDVSERMEIEKTLREREAMFRNTFDQAAVGMAHTALDGYWLRVNARMCAITGYSRKELLTRRFQDITHPDDVDAILSHARDLLAGTIQTYTMEKRYIRKNGSHVWVNLTVALAHTPPGAQRYFITVVEEITARKVLEQQRSDILSMVAHDLSNPLTVMKTRLQLIRRQLTAGKTSEASVIKTAASALTRMERLVGDLRDAASGDTHQLALKIAPYNVAALCRAEAEAQMQTNKGRQIDLILPAEPITAEVDSDRITRLLGNLLSNAIKYSPPDQPITLSLERQFESSPNGPIRAVARIAVRDRGIGIAPDVQPNIFKRFYRAPGIHEEQLTQPSLGLGLYICRMLVEEHGGFIGAESTLGQGSTFFVTLPLAHPKESRS